MTVPRFPLPLKGRRGGGLLTLGRSRTLAPQSFPSPVTAFTDPSYVLVMPHNLATVTIQSPSKVVVRGGNMWSPPQAFSKETTCFDAPDTVDVYPQDGTKQTFHGLQAFEVHGGTGPQVVLGSAAAGEVDAADGASAASAPDYGPPLPTDTSRLSWQQLADLNRALTPAEQARVDAGQAAQAAAAQRREEATPYTDPKTGKKRVAKVNWGSGDRPPATPPGTNATPRWQWALGIAGGALAVAGLTWAVKS